ncbi:MAG: DedA family protein, partial [Ottowia sp.]|nr:DedA family protein [Ottowia sp.]
IKLYPDLFWPAIFVATAGNVTGGMIDWWMGYGAKLAVFRLRRAKKYRTTPRKYNRHLLIWCRRYGPPMLLLSWLPIIGDPLCIVAGWLRLPWRECLLYMTIGKFLRYTTTTLLLLWVPNQFWQQLWTQLF